MANGDKGAVAFYLALASLFLAVIAIGRDAVDFYKWVRASPDTVLEKGNTVQLIYDPSGPTLGLTFEFALLNNGTENDLIKEVVGRLQYETPVAKQQIPFQTTDFACTAQGVPVKFPLWALRATPLQMSCSATTSLGDLSREVLTKVGSKKWLVDFVGARTYTMGFCFAVTESIRDSLLGSVSNQSLRFLYPDCR